jgi:hypothetical protein
MFKAEVEGQFSFLLHRPVAVFELPTLLLGHNVEVKFAYMLLNPLEKSQVRFATRSGGTNDISLVTIVGDEIAPLITKHSAPAWVQLSSSENPEHVEEPNRLFSCSQIR